MRGVFYSRDCEIRYFRTRRSKNPIFLFQPFPGSEYIYRPLMEKLLKQNPNLDIINFTFPGLGGRSKILKRKIITVEEYIDITSDFIKSLNPDSYSIIACSFGGYVACLGLSKGIFKPSKVILLSPLLNSKRLLNRSLKFQKILLKSLFKLRLPKNLLLSINYIYIWFVEWRKKMNSHSNKLIPKVEKEFAYLDTKESISIFEELERKRQPDINDFKKKIFILVGDSDIPDIIKDCEGLKNKGYRVDTVKDGSHGYVFLDPVQTSNLISPFLFED